MRRHVSLLALLAALGAAGVTPHAQAQGRLTPEALALALQQRYQRITDFRADFTHTYRGGVLRTETRERGTVVVKKPGRMRWVYTAPERKEFVSDGQKIYSYIPEDRQVIVAAVPPDDQASSAPLFLAGKGNISRDFSPAYGENPAAGTLTLKLTPHRPDPDFDYLVLVADQATLQIRSVTTRDRQGGESTLAFTHLQENQGISDKEFTFRIPRGVDVTDATRN